MFSCRTCRVKKIVIHKYTKRTSHVPEKDSQASAQIGTLTINSTEYAVKTGITKIGRFEHCDIVIKDVTVSKIHAQIIEASGDQRSTWILDLNSSNKTKLDNVTLKPNLLYELKDESTIKFGRVSAVYRACRSANDTLIPETPALTRRKGTTAIIPNTPDSSFNDSSVVESDDSVILSTQRDEKSDVFRQPIVPQPRQSNNRQNSSVISSNESNDSQIVLHISDTDIDKNREINIFDVETQNFEEGHSGASNSIYDVETQILSTDAPEQTSNRSSRPNVQNKIIHSSATDVHDLENYESNISELETQRNEENIGSVTAKQLTTSIHDVETQKYISDSGKGHIEVQKSGNVKNESWVGDLDQIDLNNIDSLKTQRLNDERITEDIFDMETQLELDNSTNAVRNISDLETQLESNDGFIEERADKDNNEDIAVDIIKSKANYENMGLSDSRSNSSKSLNLSSLEINEDVPSSPLNQSGHLLESTELLEFFGEGIDRSDEVETYNAASTPKSQAKVSSKAENNANENRSNTQDDNDVEDDMENIFDASTQCINSKFEALASKDANEKDTLVTHKKRGTPQLEQSDHDSETDAEEYIEELAEKQRKCLEIPNKSCNESAGDRKDDPGASVDSEDLFEMPTQRYNDRAIDDTSKSPINRLSKTNEPDAVDDVTYDQDNRAGTPSNIDDMPTQLISSQGASISPSKNNQDDVDDMAPTQIINLNDDVQINVLENLDQEDLNYEMAPTQRIGEEEENSGREKVGESSNPNINDTIEQNLNVMFDDVSNENIHECQQMSTQLLEKILESSASDNDLSTSATDNVLQTRLRKKKRTHHSRSLRHSSSKANAHNNIDTDSQNSDIRLANVTTRRKRNIKDTQNLVESINDPAPSENANSSQTSKADGKKTDDDSVATRSSNKEKRLSKTKNKFDTDPTSNDNDVSTISKTKERKHLRRTRSMKSSDKAASEQILEEGSSKVAVDDAEEHSTAESGICAPCPLANGQGAETSSALPENDDDILSRLPAVRMSGTLSNPGSPSSASSTSIVYTLRLKSKKGVAKNREKNVSLKKSRHRQIVEDSKQDEDDFNETRDEPAISLLDNRSSSLKTWRISKTLDAADSSEDSDCDLRERFQQIAERILIKQPNYEKSRNEGNVQNASPAVPDRKRSTRTSNVSKNSKQNADAESTNPPLRASSRITRHSNRQNDGNSLRASQKENFTESILLRHRLIATSSATSTESTAKKLTESETMSVVKRKRDLNVMDENVEDTNLKKRKANQVTEENAMSMRSRRSVMKAADRQSPNILEYSAKSSSRENSPVIESRKSSEASKAVFKAAAMESQKTALKPKTGENVGSGRSNVRRTRRNINETQATTSKAATANGNNDGSKQVQSKKKEMKTSPIGGKVLKEARIVISPIKSVVTSAVRDESQEVENIMEIILSNVDDKNLSIRRNSSAKIFKRKSRIGRGKQDNTSTDSTSTESSLSSDVDYDTQLDSSVLLAKRGRFADNSISLRTRAVATGKKEVFKRPTRAITSVLNSSMESTTDSLSSSRSNISSSSRASRSSAKRKKSEMNQNTRGTSLSLETAFSGSPSSRTRRSMSTSSSSTPTSTHRILFTGITEDYSKIIKTLGGTKVEEPSKCTVLVTDKVRRTYKFLCALAQGIPVVSIDWLNDSKSVERFLDWEGYILKDPAAEAKFGFRLRKSLEKAKQKKLLDGYTVVLTPGVAPPPVQELKNMVTSSGAKALLRPPAKWPKESVIISREEDLPNARKFIAKAPKTVTIQSTEFILTGILRQETDFEKFKLT